MLGSKQEPSSSSAGTRTCPEPGLTPTPPLDLPAWVLDSITEESLPIASGNKANLGVFEDSGPSGHDETTFV
jgi:hypothetical protein